MLCRPLPASLCATPQRRQAYGSGRERLAFRGTRIKPRMLSDGQKPAEVPSLRARFVLRFRRADAALPCR